MSHVSTANVTAPRSASNAMQLPNIPRLTSDEKSRSKYISEYEKFEPELRRHHIGTAETTNTLGLKDVPAEFDRKVPSLSEPTKAEVEFARQHPSRVRSARKPTEGGATAAGNAVAATYLSANNSTLMNFAAASLTKRGTVQLDPLSPGSQQQQQRGDGTARSPSGSQKASFEWPLQRESEDLSYVAAPPPGETAENAAAPEDRATTAAAARAVAAAPTAASRTPHFPKAPSPPSLVKKSAPPNVKVTMSVPRMRSAPPLIKIASNATTAAAPVPHRVTALRSNSARRVYTTFSPPPQQSSTAAKGTNVAEEIAGVLFVLLEPPSQYVASLDLDLSRFDLDWIRTGEEPPMRLTTIANYSDVSGAAIPPVKINSPRSAITLLKHGVSLKDWAISDADSTTGGGASVRPPSELGEQYARLRAELQQHRRARLQAQQKAMREKLENSYQALCSRAPLQELLTCYRQLRRAHIQPDAGLDGKDAARQSTATQQRQERQRRVFEANKMRMLRQVEQAKQMQARLDAAERRQQQAEAEAEEERRRKAAEAMMARKLQQERLEARRAEREQREEAVRLELQARLTKVEARNAERAAARERQQKALHEEKEAQAAERARRMERYMAALEEQAELQEKRRLEKEKKMEELRIAREVRLAEEQRLLTEKQQRAAQLRSESRQRAAEVEEAAREAALERQAQVEARLQDFYAFRREEAAQRAAAEAGHQKRFEEIRAEAAAKEERFKASIYEKLQQHEERYQDTRTRQLTAIAWRREMEKEEQEDKAYAVLQLHRIAEFNKLHTVLALLEKSKAANAVTQQRKLICEQAMRAREKLHEERDALKQQLANTAS